MKNFSTEDVAPRERPSWLREVIGREYADVEITPPGDGSLFNEMTIHPWEALKLSTIRSNAITIERLSSEPRSPAHDSYFAVIPLAGNYMLEQDGRETRLRPGDIAIYDATRPHRIHCPGKFTKMIVSVPRPLLRDRIAGIEHCTARRVPGNKGIGAVAAGFIRTAAGQAGGLSAAEFAALSGHSLDLLALAAASVRPASLHFSPSRALTLARIKEFVERRLSDPELDSAMVAAWAGLSSRHVNNLFEDEGASLMRHILNRRLENCRRDLEDPRHFGHGVGTIAFRWGFNDLSHFSRAFKKRFGRSPRAHRQENAFRFARDVPAGR